MKKQFSQINKHVIISVFSFLLPMALLCAMCTSTAYAVSLSGKSSEVLNVKETGATGTKSTSGSSSSATTSELLEYSPMDPNSIESAEGEALVDIYYSNVIRQTISARYRNDKFYFPIVELFSLLHINYKIDVDKRIVAGNYGIEQIPYTLNLKTGEAEFDTKRVIMDTNNVFIGALDYYLTADEFEQVFSMQINADMKALSAVIITDRPLPIVIEMQKMAQWGKLSSSNYIDQYTSFNEYPLIVGIRRPLLDGGGLSYSLNASTSGNVSGYSGALRGGFRFLGGDALVNVAGNYIPLDKRVLIVQQSQWRFALEENRYLNTISAGLLQIGNNVIPMQLQGGRISNEPLNPRMLHTTTKLSGSFPAGWKAIEVIRNNEIVDVQSLSSDGSYSVDVPIYNGITIYKVRGYGPSGEKEEETFMYNAPAASWEGGRIIYNVSGGQDMFTKELGGNANVSIGITDWLTNRTSVDYLYKSRFIKDPQYMNSTILRLFDSWILTADVAPTSFYRGSLNKIFPNFSMFDVIYTRFVENSIWSTALLTSTNPVFAGFGGGAGGGSGLIDRTFVGYSTPLPWIGNTRFYAGMDRAKVSNTFQYGTDFAAQFAGITAMVGYRGIGMQEKAGENGAVVRTSISQFINANLMYNYMSTRPGFFNELFNGTMFSSQINYNITTSTVQGISALLMKTIVPGLMFGVNASYIPLNNFYMGGLNLTWNVGPFFLNSTSNFSPNAAPAFNTSLNGAIGIDSRTGSMSFQPNDWLGNASVLMRPFLDANDNGVFDDGEKLISARVNTAFGGQLNDESDKGTELYGIPPYARVSATVDEESVSNPLYVPKYKKFSFYSEPSSLKPIDVPFIAGGTVEGVFTRVLKDGTTRPASGYRVHLYGVTDSSYHSTLMTFTDGTFYFMSVPPGSYIVSPDTVQLSLVKATVAPMSQPFTIVLKPDGDAISGLNFSVTAPERTLEDNKPVYTQKIVQKPYYVVLGASTTYADADAISQKIKKNYSLMTSVVKLNTDMFIVTSGLYQSALFADSAANDVVRRSGIGTYTIYDQDICPTLKASYQLVVSSFLTLAEAQKYVTLNKSKYSAGSLVIDYDLSSQQYDVMTSTSYPTLKEAQQLSQSTSSSYTGSKIIVKNLACGSKGAFSVTVSKYASLTEARSAAQQVSTSANLPCGVTYDVASAQFVVSVNRTVNSQKDADTYLNKVKQTAFGKNASVVKN